MDTDDDVSTLEEEEATLSESETWPLGGELPDEPKGGFHFNPEAFLSSDINEPVKFHVVCAHTEVSDTGKYVLYTIDIERGDDSRPALLERRYSDFNALYRALRQSHPALLSNVKFPRKVIVGNFKSDVIAERSRFFSSFLTAVHGMDVLRWSDAFQKFLFGRELAEADRLVLHSQLDAAAPALQNLFWLLQKVRADRDRQLRVLLQLTAVLQSLGSLELSHDYALLALPRFDCLKDTHSPSSSTSSVAASSSNTGSSVGASVDGESLVVQLYVPFLHFCARLWWVLGRSRAPFEARLAEARKRGFPSASADLLLCLRDRISLDHIRP